MQKLPFRETAEVRPALGIHLQGRRTLLNDVGRLLQGPGGLLLTFSRDDLGLKKLIVLAEAYLTFGSKSFQFINLEFGLRTFLSCNKWILKRRLF